ncbi:hypothetical protein PPL_10633 [Heterostelium album PN500]|uniref:EGF-like domain-containing protein n=1 Tax=Heterostelium pallidum (strain ATCC 26659 / Pp 5 / PN500) TaxID=670386 RepID=D3BRM2_HETP5|nr:hypothetical protein PPL_10633 [Heterostelium album PN500]EFA76054.1 hypothetical protein PPL_10633 [Heterostelium album PN500]|eukprot:XP_020428188.1 hypothetical protein PPL_10633 [Heterostelium album PN500]
MKFDNFIFKFVLIYSVCVGLAHAQSVFGPYPGNGHYYQLISYAGSTYDAAVANINSQAAYQTLQPYLATINNEEEFNYITSQITIVPIASKRIYVSGIFDSGFLKYNGNAMEKGSSIYSYPTARCFTFCKFANEYPSAGSAQVYLSLNKTGTVWALATEDFVANSYYLVEYGGLKEPLMAPPPSAGGPVTISNFVTSEAGVAWSINNVQVFKDGVSLPIITYGTNLLVVQWPAGVNRYDLVITDNRTVGAHPQFNLKSTHYDMPYITTLYAKTFTANSVITLNGGNFGTDPSVITINYGSTAAVCGSVAILEAHNSITCKLGTATNKNTVTLLPMTVAVGSNNFVYTTNRIPFYDYNTGRVIQIFQEAKVMYGASSGSTDASFNYLGYQRRVFNSNYIDNNYCSLGYVLNEPQSETILNNIKLDNEIFIAGYAPGSTFKVTANGGPNDGSTLISSIGTGVCTNTTMYCPNPNYLTGGMYFATYARVIYYGQLTGQGQSYKAGMFFQCGNYPAAAAAITYSVDTAGGLINFATLNGCGFKYSTRSFDLQAVNYPGIANIYQIGNTTLGLNIPAGTGANLPLTVYIENTQLKNALISYKAPTISSITPALTSFGGTIIITGTQYGPNVNGISGKWVSGSTTLTCQSFTMVTAHTQLKCTLGGATGSGVFTLTVNGQIVTFGYAFSPPIIQSASQSGTTLSLNGIGFGLTTAGVTSSLSMTSTSLTTVSDPQTYSGTVPSNTKNQPITFTVASIMSAPYYLTFQPSLSSVSKLSPNAVSTINIGGNFLQLTRLNNTVCESSILIDGVTPCTSPLSTTSGNGLSCNAPAMTGTHSLTVTIDGKTSTPIQIVANSPSVSSYVQTGYNIVITGTNFGLGTASATVSIGTYTITTGVTVTSTTTITTTLPSNIRNDVLKVTIDGLPSNTIDFKATPTITSTSLVNTVGGNLVITGTYFNSLNGGNNPVTIAVLANGQTCANPSVTIDNTEITCTLSAGTGYNLPVKVTVDGVSANSVFAFKAPLINSASLNNGQIIITGTDFGTTNNNVQVSFSGASIPLASISSDATTASFNIPTNALNSPIVLTVAGQASNPYPFTLTPSLNSVSQPKALGGQVQISGSYLSTKNYDGSTNDLAVTIDGTTTCTNPTGTSSSLTCTVPAGYGTGHSMVVTIGSLTSNSLPFAYQAPTVTLFNQYNTHTVINGTNFGLDTSQVSVAFGQSQPAAPINLYSSPESMEIVIPEFTKNGKLQVTAGGQTSSLFDYKLSPVLESVTSVGSSGGLITIKGHFLNVETDDGTPTTISVTLLPDIECTGVAKLDDTTLNRITCTLPGGSAENLQLQVTIDGLSSIIAFSYGAPLIHSITVSPSNQVNITGENLFNLQNSPIVNWGSTLQFSTVTTSGNSVIFTVPDGTLGDYVGVTLKNRASNTYFVSLYPIITSITASKTSGSDVVVTGTYLNSYNADGSSTNVTVTIDGQPCDVVADQSTNEKTITAPYGVGSNHVVVFYVNGQSSTISTFNYIAPTITAISQNVSQITITGDNFGNNTGAIELPSGVTLDSVTHDTVIALLPASYKSGTFNVIVGGQTGSSAFVVTPYITEFTSVNALGGDITVSGLYFNIDTQNGDATEISVIVGTQNCAYVKNIADTNIVCTLGSHAFNHKDIQVTIDNQYNIMSGYSSLPPTVLSATGLTFGTAGTVTISGIAFVEPINSVRIGGTECTTVDVVDSSHITCEFSADVVGSSVIGLEVVVSNAGIEGSANVFLYSQLDCSNQCVNGTCTNGYCACVVGYSGQFCDIAVADIVHPASPWNPIQIYQQFLQNQYFISGLSYVREVNTQTGSVINSINLMDNSFTSIGNDQFQTSEGSVTVTVTITVFIADTTSYNFAGELMAIPNGAIKHSVQVTGWQFADQSNSLQVVYRASAPESVAYNCTTSPSTITSSDPATTKMSQSFLLDTEAGIMYISVSNRAYIDGGVGYVSAVSLPSSGFPASPNTNILYYAIQVPAFASGVTVDPTFVAYNKPNLVFPNCPTPTTTGNTPTTNTPTTNNPTTSTTGNNPTTSTTGSNPTTSTTGTNPTTSTTGTNPTTSTTGTNPTTGDSTTGTNPTTGNTPTTGEDPTTSTTGLSSAFKLTPSTFSVILSLLVILSIFF